MKKRKAVDSYFHAIRNTVGKDRSVIMPYGNGSFPRPSKDEDSVPRGSMKRHLLTRSAGEHRTSRGCLFCQKNDLASVTADGRVQENSTSLHWRRCTACNRAEEAGRGEGTSRRGMQKDKLVAMSTRRGGIAEMKGKKRPSDLQNAKSSL
jgi:hypothetical protein